MIYSYALQLQGSVWRLCRITQRLGVGCEAETSRVSPQNWLLRSATVVIQNCMRKETLPRSWSSSQVCSRVCAYVGVYSQTVFSLASGAS